MRGKVDSRAMREVNRSIVLDMIRRGGRISRTDLARRSSLTKPTISAIVEDLIASGIVQEVGYGKTVPSGGRRARLLQFNEESAAYLGIRFGVHNTTVAVSDARGEIKSTLDTKSILGQPDRAIDAALGLIDEALQAAEIPRARLQSVGVAVAGVVDQNSGSCVMSPNLGWDNVPVRERLREALELPVVVNNNTDAAALAEGRIGAAKGYGTYVWLYVGTGVGAGIVIDGRLYYGRQGFTGEIGHCRLSKDGPILEDVASGKAIQRAAEQALEAGRATKLSELERPISAGMVAQVAREGDEVASSILAEVGAHLGLGVSYLLNILNPEIVVVGGRVAEAGEGLLNAVRASAAHNALKPENVQIVASTLGDQAGIVGAVLLAMEHSVQSYRIVATNARMIAE